MRVNRYMMNNAVSAARFAAMLFLSLLIGGTGCSRDTDAVDEAEAGPSVAVQAAALTGDEGPDDLEGAGYAARSDECCSGPGEITECWVADAKDDGVTCEADEDCPSNMCDTEMGLCMCETDGECNDGVCTDDGICGPSWCNGYRLCSCWGGCEYVNGDKAYDVVCAANDMGCCEGTYPIHPDMRADDDSGIGYCSQCNDGNPCTLDRCDGRGGCIHTPTDGACDDGLSCTVNDTCESGHCAGEPMACSDGNPCTDDSCDEVGGCMFTNNTAACDDGDSCTVDDRCLDGVCNGGEGRGCSDGNPCTDDECDSVLGCTYVLNDDLCDDENACTTGERCIVGVCGGGTALECDDGNPCTDDSCDTDLGCVNTPNTDPCDDGNACTMTDVCSAGECVGSVEPECDDGNPCTDDSCVPSSGCLYVNNDDPCDDGNACTTGDMCADGVCVAHPLSCDDGNQCTDDLCTELGCEYPYNEDGCDDNNVCTVDDRCSVGGCAGTLIYWRFEELDEDNSEGEIVDWVGNYSAEYENDAYTVPNGKIGRAGWFGPGTGSNVGKATTDYHVYDNSRTMSFWIKFDDVTAGHQVVGSSSGAGKRFYLGIDGDNQIFAGYGNAFVGWSHDSVPSTVESGEWVRMAMTYDGEEAHVYVNGVELISFDARFVGEGVGPEFFLGTGEGNVMIDEVIVDERYWDQSDVDLDYDDGNGPDPYRYVIDCDDGNPCTDDSCDKDDGCVHTPSFGACDDGDSCTENDVCAAGVCGGSPISCDDGNACTTDDCDPSEGCVHEDNSVGCDDGDACTVHDQCSEGSCAGTALECDDGNVCTDDSCDTSVGCVYENNDAACDDGNLCTASDTCAAGSCSGIPIDCEDDNGCTIDSCNPSEGCVFTQLDPCPGCTVDADCQGEIVCDEQPGGCSSLACVDGECMCEPVAEETVCTDIDIGDYPPGCYTGQCDALGACRPIMGAAENNLCSDLFTPAEPTIVDTTSDGWLGSFTNTQASGTLNVTGSTLCASNNYFAGGEECEEHSTGAAIGTGGSDLVYAFQYQTNAVDQFELYSYIIKVQADFDVGIYIKSDIASAEDCPEGNQPSMDTHDQTFLKTPSERCAYPYQNSPMPPVVEDECRDNGNTVYGQECCDPCMSGESCGYKWCRRGYNNNGSSCDVCEDAGGPGYDPLTHKGNCDAIWTYPEDPYDCSSELPEQAGYSDYDYVASAVISPDGATDGSSRTVFVFVDGVTSSQGNFYLTVEKRRWWAGPCDRVDDDGRVYDISNVGASGETFQGTFEGVVNSVHASGGSCGGYGCDGEFSGKSSCHASGDSNQFWPNQELFKIHRASGQGSAVYCIETDESVASSADLVMNLSRRSSRDALTICDESYEGYGCAHNSDGSNIQWEVTAEEGYLYLLEVSQYQYLNRVCTSSEGDNCRYRFRVTEGACPVTCVSPSTWYGGGIEAVYAIDGSTFFPDAVVDGSTGSNSRDYDPGDGWDGKDGLYQLNVTASSRVRFSGCNDGGSGSFDGQAAIFDCEGNRVAQDDDGCGWGGMPKITVDLSAARSPYYLLVDGYSNSDSGSFGFGMSYR